MFARLIVILSRSVKNLKKQSTVEPSFAAERRKCRVDNSQAFPVYAPEKTVFFACFCLSARFAFAGFFVFTDFFVKTIEFAKKQRKNLPPRPTFGKIWIFLCKMLE